MSDADDPALARDWHGARRAYRRLDTGGVGRSLHALAQSPLRLDRLGVLDAWGLANEPERTVLLDVRKLPCAHDIQAAAPRAWPSALEADVAAIARRARAPVLALGGGLDAAAVLAAWRATGLPLPAVMTVETGLGTYDEVEKATLIAASLGARCEVASISPLQLVDLLPAAVRAAEAPLYNLHPISRFALARVAADRGYQTLITGDGADAAFAHRPDPDYVPIVVALTEAIGMTLESPFLESSTLSAIMGTDADPGKQLLRDYVAPSGLPGWLSVGSKHPRWMPPLEVSRFLSTSALEPLAEELEIPLRLDSDRERVGWATLGLLVRSLEGQG